MKYYRWSVHLFTKAKLFGTHLDVTIKVILSEIILFYICWSFVPSVFFMFDILWIVFSSSCLSVWYFVDLLIYFILYIWSYIFVSFESLITIHTAINNVSKVCVKITAINWCEWSGCKKKPKILCRQLSMQSQWCLASFTNHSFNLCLLQVLLPLTEILKILLFKIWYVHAEAECFQWFSSIFLLSQVHSLLVIFSQDYGSCEGRRVKLFLSNNQFSHFPVYLWGGIVGP